MTIQAHSAGRFAGPEVNPEIRVHLDLEVVVQAAQGSTRDASTGASPLRAREPKRGRNLSFLDGNQGLKLARLPIPPLRLTLRLQGRCVVIS